MKRILSIGLAMFFALSSSALAVDNSYIQKGVAAYKSADYVGCLQNMVEVIKDDPSNVLAHYYIGMAHIKLGHKEMGERAYRKVIALNTNPHLTKLAQSGLNKMNEKPQENKTEAAKEEAKKEITAKTAIERNIKYLYGGNHFATEKCESKIRQIELNNEKNDVNASVMLEPINSEEDDASVNEDEKKNLTNNNSAPTDKEIADAVRVLAKVGFVPYQMGYPNINTQENAAAQLNMLAGTNKNDMLSMLPFLISSQAQGQQNNINQDYIKTMMMTDMISNLNGSLFNSGTNNTY